MKAVIAVAGMGTRFYLIAKTICKCMLPVLDQPVLAYAVADCIAAGATQIAIVTVGGEPGRQVRHYFTEDTSLAAYYTARGQPGQYEPIAHLHDQAGTGRQPPTSTSAGRSCPPTRCPTSANSPPEPAANTRPLRPSPPSPATTTP